MFRKLLFISLALFLAASAVKFTLFSEPAMAAPVAIDRSTREQILESTVCITMFAPLTDGHGNPQSVQVDGQRAIQLTVNEGLGTMAIQGEKMFLVTHDHWPLLTADLQRVEFHNANHEPLLQLEGEQFIQLIRYRDGGTIVLAAPDQLVGRLTAVPLGNSASVHRSDIVTIAHRQPWDGQIGVALMQVQKELIYKGQPVYRLNSLQGEAVVEGNSGGGVLFHGQLVGNVWGAILTEEVSRFTGKSAGAPQQTSFSLAALLPDELAAD